MIQTLGILQTDDVQPEWQEEFGTYPTMFRKLFTQVTPELKFKTFDVTRLEHPRSLKECNAYLITGSRAGAYEDRQWIGELKQLIRAIATQGIPLAGICFGHQVIAAAFHAKVIKAAAGWGVGVHEYRLNQPLNGLAQDDKFKLIATHQDQVVEVPVQARILAQSAFCPIAALISTEKNFITFQGHPEFSKEYFLHLLNNRLTKIGEERTAAAHQSMSQDVVPTTIAAAIMEFFNQPRQSI